jgi:hypothetical protein
MDNDFNEKDFEAFNKFAEKCLQGEVKIDISVDSMFEALMKEVPYFTF